MKIKLDEGTKVHLGILLYGIALVVLMCFLPHNSNGQSPSQIAKVMEQSIQMSYDSATIILPTKTLELKVETRILFDATGFNLSTNDPRLYTYIVTGSEFDPMPTRRFYDMNTILEVSDSTTHTKTLIYGVVGYPKVQVAVVMNSNMNKKLAILKQDKTGIILH